MVDSTAYDFRKLFESVQGLFVVLVSDRSVFAVSDAYLDAVGTTRERIIGKNYFEVFPQQPQEARASIEATFTTGKSHVTSALQYGVKYWATTNTPIFSPEGNLNFVICRIEDMTSRMRQEAEYRTIEEERDLLFKYSVDLLAIVGADGFFKKVNPAFETTLGYSPAEMLAKPVIEFLHPDDVDRTRQGIQKLTGGIPTIASRNRYRCKDGGYRWFSWNTTPIGELFYTVGRDITEQVTQEETIRALNDELERRNFELEEKIQERVGELHRSQAQVLQLQKMDAVGRLAGGIAHDFNNMLGAISLSCDLLEEDAENPEAVRGRAHEIVEAIDRAATLTRQLLVFSRQQVVCSQAVELNPLIHNLSKMLTRLIGENIEIVTKLDPDLHIVSADPSQLEQVVMNLVVNARDAMPSGGRITIETSNVYLDESFTGAHFAVKEGHYVLLSISDEGCGMDADTLAKIFDPFFTTKPVGKGTGLGLTTAYGVIKQCKGTIWVYSERGRGTVFKVYLPVTEKVVAIAEVPARSSPALPGGQTILLVEDDENLRRGFADILQRRGYRVLIALDADEAIALCRYYRETIHLLLTDMIMPGMSGFALAQKALGLRTEMRVIHMSGYTDEALEHAGAGSLERLSFLQKPFSANVLIAKVLEVLAQSETTDVKS